jgi:hypothetical protein
MRISGLPKTFVELEIAVVREKAGAEPLAVVVALHSDCSTLARPKSMYLFLPPPDQ